MREESCIKTSVILAMILKMAIKCLIIDNIELQYDVGSNLFLRF